MEFQRWICPDGRTCAEQGCEGDHPIGRTIDDDNSILQGGGGRGSGPTFAGGGLGGGGKGCKGGKGGKGGKGNCKFVCKNAAVTEGGSGQRKWSHTQTHDGSPVDASASHAISQEVIDQNPITSVVTAVDSEHDGTGARERKGSAAVGMIHVVTDEPVRSGVVHTEQGLGSNREATEHVHMHDCRNVIDLIDLVTRGRLQATIDAQRAGVVGMSGNGGGGASMSSAALIIFACLGVTYTLIFTFCVVMVGLGKLPVVQFFASGLWLLGLAGPSGIMRAGLLHTLKPQGEALGAGRARAGSGMHRASQRLIKLNSLAQGSFAVFIVSLALCTAWFGIYYGASGGALNMWPILPRKPTRGFATYIGVALPLVALLELNILWIGFTRNKKIAQLFGKMGFTSRAFTGLYVFTGSFIGLLFCAASFLAADETIWPRLSLAAFGLSLIALALLFGWKQYRKQIGAMTDAIRGDIAAYEAVWDAIRANPSHANDLRIIEDMLSRQPSPQPIVARAWDVQTRNTTEQLIILLAQAWAVNDKFQHAMASWKRASCAAVHDEGESKGADRGDPSVAAEAVGNKVLMPKQRKRAIEKVWRSYGGDATRLRDLVRGSIVFDTVSEMKASLALILADQNIRILGVKNRFAAKYDAVKMSCGYRDIQISVTLSATVLSSEEVDAGLHELVCEVQLHLAPIYALKNDEGHKRYVEFRNSRAK
jgi:hypothetical protein